MPDGYPIQTNFTSGEISPLMTGRVDVNKYFNGARKLVNFHVKPQGGAFRRSGTRIAHEVKDSSAVTILRRFEFSTSQAYVLEFGNQYVRFYRDRGIILTGGVPVEVVTPYLTADLRQLSFAESADILYIAHPSYPTMVLERTSDISWTLSVFQTKDGPYMSVTPDGNLTAAVLSDTVVATASTGIFTPPASKAILSIQNSGGLVKINTTTSHGFTTGNSVTIAGVTGLFGIGAVNGLWVVTVLTANSFTLNGSVCPFIIFPITLGTAALFGFLGYLEYRKNNLWYLSQVIQATSTTKATVKIIDPILQPDLSVQLQWNGAQVFCTTSSGVFVPTDVGKYVRVNTAPSIGWYLITAFSSTSVVTATPLSMVTYTYPTTIVVVDESTRVVSLSVTADQNVFLSTDVGRWLRLEFLGSVVAGTIIAYVSATNVIVQSAIPLPFDPNAVTQPSNNGVASRWKIGAWSQTTGYPSCVGFHQQRLTFASSIAEPQTIWMSKSGDYPNFAPTGQETVPLDDTVSDNNAITATIASQTVNQIVWMNSGPVLLLGTIAGEWVVKSSSIADALTPTNFNATQQTSFGGIQTPPIRVGVALLYVQRGGQKVREMAYNFQFDQYESKDLTIVSEHIIRVNGKAIDSSYAQESNSLFWVVTDQGALACITYQRDQEVYAWTNHVIGGTNALVEAIATIPSTNQKTDTTYLIVKRTINGATKRYVEFFEDDFWPSSPTDKNTMLFMDCAATYTGSPVNTVTGLSYLEAENVVIVADGSIRKALAPVSSGSVTFDGDAASVVNVGLKYTSTIQMMPIESGSQQGTAQGKIKRLDKLVMRILNSLDFKYGSDLSNLQPYIVRKNTDPMDASAPLFTGDVEHKITGTYERDPKLYIIQDQPYPLTVIAIMPHLATNAS